MQNPARQIKKTKEKRTEAVSWRYFGPSATTETGREKLTRLALSRPGLYFSPLPPTESLGSGSRLLSENGGAEPVPPRSSQRGSSIFPPALVRGRREGSFGSGRLAILGLARGLSLASSPTPGGLFRTVDLASESSEMCSNPEAGFSSAEDAKVVSRHLTLLGRQDGRREYPSQGRWPSV